MKIHRHYVFSNTAQAVALIHPPKELGDEWSIEVFYYAKEGICVATIPFDTKAEALIALEVLDDFAVSAIINQLIDERNERHVLQCDCEVCTAFRENAEQATNDALNRMKKL